MPEKRPITDLKDFLSQKLSSYKNKLQKIGRKITLVVWQLNKKREQTTAGLAKSARVKKLNRVMRTFRPEFFVAATVLIIFGFSQSALFNQILTSSQNSSWAFKTLLDRNHLNEPILQLAATNSVDPVGGLVLGASKASAWDEGIVQISSGTNEFNNDNLNFLTALDNSTVIKPSLAVPSAPRADNDSNIGVYKVAEGDTPITIASRFGVSLATLLVENNLHEKSLIKPGQELRILPISGTSYTIKEGDTLLKLMEKFKLTEDEILDANDRETEEDLLVVGSAIAIPNDNLAVPQPPPPTRLVTNNVGRIALSQATPNTAFTAGAGTMVWPTTSRVITQYFWRHHNGLDISGHGQNPGPPIFAADNGFVEVAGWQQGGWGNTVVINHGNGLKTRYAHLSVISVRAGQTVSAGQQIGLIGNTGRSTGPHLHFTVYRGGVAVDPLQYIRP